MPTVWRLAAPEYAGRLDGRGNIGRGARWNSPGRGVVYASLNLSLAVLETLVQLPPSMRFALPDLMATRIEIPDNAGTTQISLREFERAMAAADPASACRAIGDQWLAAGKDLMLTAPSIVVREESNLMLNPAHPRMREVRIVSSRHFRFDPRLAASAPPG
jgi:RES domain-containing protein